MGRNRYRYVPLPGLTVRRSRRFVVTSVTVRRVLFVVVLTLSAIYGGMAGLFVSFLVFAWVGRKFYRRRRTARVTVDPQHPYDGM